MQLLHRKGRRVSKGRKEKQQQEKQKTFTADCADYADFWL
jgi:hypothetical protein